MSRSRKRPSYHCPEGHKCNFCGGKASADHRDAQAPLVDEFERPDESFDTIRECLLCGVVAPEWQLSREVCPHGLE